VNKPLFNTTDELISFVNLLDKNVTDVVLVTKTEVKMNKKDVETKSIANTYIGTTKTQVVRVALNEDYEQRVNIMRSVECKDRDFESGELAWGTCANNIVVENNGKKYIKTIELGKVGAIEYDLNGQKVSYDELKPFIPVPSKSVKQNLDNEVKVRTFSVDSIIELRVGGSVIYRRAA